MKTLLLVMQATLVAAFVCNTAIAADLQGNIPAQRLEDNTYTSLDGSYTLTLPSLATPGAKAEERRVSEAQTGVFFADDFGDVYYVLQIDNTQLKYDLDKIAAGYTFNEALREKAIVPSARGSELRLAGIIPGGSPIVKQTKEKGKTIQQNVDLYQAMCLFVTATQIFEVAAGVTATHQESDIEMIARAKKHLDTFLDGLRIKGTAPLQN